MTSKELEPLVGYCFILGTTLCRLEAAGGGGKWRARVVGVLAYPRPDVCDCGREVFEEKYPPAEGADRSVESRDLSPGKFNVGWALDRNEGRATTAEFRDRLLGLTEDVPDPMKYRIGSGYSLAVDPARRLRALRNPPPYRDSVAAALEAAIARADEDAARADEAATACGKAGDAPKARREAGKARAARAEAAVYRRHLALLSGV